MGLAKATQISASRVGQIRPHHDTTAPSGWALCDGTSASRTTHAELFALMSLTRTGTTVNASTTVTLSSTAPVAFGCRVEGAGIQAGTTVAAIAGTTLTLSLAATASASGVTITFVPHGAADTSTFSLPKLVGRLPMVSTTLNQRGGYGSVTLDATYLPQHTHTVADGGHYHSPSSYGYHGHNVNGSGFAVPYDDPPSDWTIGAGSGGGSFANVFGYTTGYFSQTLYHSIGTTNAVGSVTTTTGTSTISDPNIQPTRSATYIIRTEP